MCLYQLQRMCYYPESYPTVSLLSSLKLFMQWLSVPLSGRLQKGLCSWVNLMTASIPFTTKILSFPVCSVSSVQFSCSVTSDSLRPHGLQLARFLCPSPTPGAYSNSCPSSWWCHSTISSSVVSFSSCIQSCPASGSFPLSQFFTSGGQSIFFGIGMKTDLFQSCGHCWVFQICWHIECSTFTASSFRI